ncbi:MAG: hypothetical protein ACQBVK_01475 [Candidatus Phytoplasma sp. TWB_XP]
MIHLQDLTMNKEDVVLASQTRKTFNEIKKGNFNKEQIITFENIYFLLKILILV